jgi:chromosome segregation ATPase
MWREKTDILHDEVDALTQQKVELTGSVEGCKTESAFMEERRMELESSIYLLEHQMGELKINTQALSDKSDALFLVYQEQKGIADSLNIEVDCLKEKQLTFEKEVSALESKRATLLESIEQIHQQIDENTRLYYANAMATMEASFDESAEKAADRFRGYYKEYEKTYLDTLEEMGSAFDGRIAEKKEMLAKLTAEFTMLKKIVESAVEERKRADNENKDLYRSSL